MFVAISIIITDYFEKKNLKSISYTCNEEPFKKSISFWVPPDPYSIKIHTHIYFE